MNILSKLTNAQLIKFIYSAAAEYESLQGKSFLIVGKNRKSDYFWFECCFEKKNFMHLLGIRSATLTAEEFYDRCVRHNRGEDVDIEMKDCSPSRNHNRMTINEKCSCCGDVLNLLNAKYMSVGEKDKWSQYVDFTYAYGADAVLGFKRPKNERYCVPITLIPKNINEFTSRRYRVLFLFEKPMETETYRILRMEIKPGIIKEHYKGFPEELGTKICAAEFV